LTDLYFYDNIKKHRNGLLKKINGGYMGSVVSYVFPVNYSGKVCVEEVVVDERADTEAARAEAFKRIRVIANTRLGPDEVAFIGEPELHMVLPCSKTELS
jgi:hypothetical protein